MSKYRRSKSWRSQPILDREILATESISGLRLLSKEYHNRIIRFYHSKDLTVEKNFHKHQQMKQAYKMINEEITMRERDIQASPSYYGAGKHHFDSEKGIVWDDKDNRIECTVEFDENENSIIKRDNEGNIVEIIDDDNVNIDKKVKNRRELYEDWDYYNKL
jgi:hypothetical protein